MDWDDTQLSTSADRMWVGQFDRVGWLLHKRITARRAQRTHVLHLVATGMYTLELTGVAGQVVDLRAQKTGQRERWRTR